MSEILTIVKNSRLHACIQLPASKSISNRALVVSHLAGGDKHPTNVSDCDDTRVMLQWLNAPTIPQTIDIGAAGTAMRFSTALLAVSPGEHVITGSQRMQNRPIGILVDALRQLGAKVEYINKDGFPPLKIGTTSPQSSPSGEGVALSGSVSSQYISALLMIGPVLPQGLTLTLTGDVVSRPYIDMTLAIMRDYGAQCEWQDERTLHVAPLPYKPTDYYVESDWSAASYWYEMVALSDDEEATVVLPGLFDKSLQGDSEGATLFEQLGVVTKYEQTSKGSRVVLTKGGTVAQRLDYDFVRIPDLAQTFVVTCCMMNIPFRFTGLQSLKIKETDRIEALKQEMRKLGYVLYDEADSILSWEGEHCPKDDTPVIDTYEDHRMAMAFAPAALTLGSISIRHPEVVSKSYPRYWQDLSAVAQITSES